MGRICPILNHPLNDGVLVNDEALVSFIQKRNVDFLAHEYVCRSCKREVEKLYKKKLKKAAELHRYRYHDASVSSLKTSRDSISSRDSSTSKHSEEEFHKQRDKTQNGKDSSISQTSLRQYNVNEVITADIVAVNQTSIEILTSYRNENIKLQENTQNLANVQENPLPNNGDTLASNNNKYVTFRKRTIRDFYTPKPNNEAAVAPNSQEFVQTSNQVDIQTVSESELSSDKDNDAIRTSQEPTTSKAAAASNLNNSILNIYTNGKNRVTPAVQDKSKTMPKTTSSFKKKVLTRHITYDSEFDHNDSDNDVIRRISQEPTTSRKTANINLNKRPISAVIDTDDEDDRALSLNAYNGTRLPHIQPVPPKRKSPSEKPSSLARDIMDDYIKNITGG